METNHNNMLLSCRSYNPQTFEKMTPEEITKFARRQAVKAENTLNLTYEEKCMYASAIYASICYFNSRNTDYQRYIKYISECKAQQEYEAKRQIGLKKETTKTIIVR